MIGFEICLFYVHVVCVVMCDGWDDGTEIFRHSGIGSPGGASVS